MMVVCYFMVAVKLLVVVALPVEVLSAQFASRKSLYCRNERVHINCTVQGGVLEWRFNPQSPSLMSESESFLRIIHSVNDELAVSWPGLTIQLEYIAVNSTHMKSTASFTAYSEFNGMTMTCAGRTDVDMVLMIARGDLHAVNSVYLSVHKTSNLTLAWDEPSLIGRPSVDYYLVGVNQMELNVTSPKVETDLVYSELNITISYYNCMELSPVTTLNLFEVCAVDQSEQPANSSTTHLLPTDDTRSRSTTASITASKPVATANDELPLQSSITYPIFISAVLGTFIATIVGMLLLFALILKVRQKITTTKLKAEDSVYEDVSITKDTPLQLHANDAYNL